ncbi:hypothetical protein ONS95_008927 [Cadophora gregata]|uniref:uncharacterized protein n=1 Tax=Cadophora gregata TaxID=51156 RepID=UPI0026DB9AF4|nr:uncharacterized protein ONS95_008927 [Cadophora gregata]KAK0123937.1 hypothetical protein ONS95_008927 [Cadophora gregata]KAK0130276.1 hypothetical protein ONS96_000799 [Cadophora gregata f. sp. sojae]
MYRIDMPGRVGESSKRSTRTRTPRSSLSQPPSSSPRSSEKKRQAEKDKKKKKTQKVEGTDDFWEIKRIVDQEERDGETWYLVDWEDNKVTGESYPYEWVHHSGVTLPAIAEWQNRPKDSTPPRGETSSLPALEPESPTDSRPVRSRKRKLVSRAEVAAKRARHASPEPSAESQAAQAIIQEHEVEDDKPEIPDSYEEERGNLQTTHVDSQDGAAEGEGEGEGQLPELQALVEIGAPKDFDPSAYTTYNFSSSLEALEPRRDFSSDLAQSQEHQRSVRPRVTDESGLSHSSSAPQARQLSPSPNSWNKDTQGEEFLFEDNRFSRTSRTPEVPSDPIQSSSPVIRRSSQAPFIWDSDIEDEEQEEPLEVPDSQEPRGSSSYKPSGTSTSRPDSSSNTTTRRNTHTDTEASLEAIESRNSQVFTSSSKQQDSGSIESQFAQRASAFDHEGYTQTPEPTSAQVLSTPTQSSHFLDAISSNPHLPESANQFLDEAAGPPAEIASSILFQPQVLSQSPAKSIEEDLSIGFQTQLPQISCNEDSRDELLPFSGSIEHDLENRRDIRSPSEEVEPAREDDDSPTKQILDQQPDLLSSPSSADWQEFKDLIETQAQTHTPSQGFLSQIHLSSASGTREDPIQIASPEDESFPEVPVLQLGDTQNSTSSKGSGHSQASSHLPSPPAEAVRPSVEDFEPLDIKYPPPIHSSTSMEEADGPAAVVSDQAKMQAPNATDILKAKMAEARAARAAASISNSPAPGLVHSNQSAVAMNRTLPVQPVDPSPAPPAVPLFESPVAPVSDPSIATASVLEAPALAEGVVPSQTPANMEPVADPEEDEEEEELINLSVLPLGRAEYEVPLSMTSYTRDIYVRRIRIYRDSLQSFLGDEILNDGLVAEVNSLLQMLQTICSHPGLLDEEHSQNENHEIQAKWAENVSTKFIFLAELLELMAATDKHIVIIAQPDQIMNELEALLMYHGINYSRADQQRTNSARQFRVTIYPAGTQQFAVDPASAVIALDSSYRTLPYLKQLRTQPSFPDQLAPVISLVVTNSFEHVNRCFDDKLNAVARMSRVASCVCQLMGRVGTFDSDGYYDPPGAANKVAEYLIVGPGEDSWPLLPMPDITNIDLSLLNSQNSSEEQSATSFAANTQSGIKRMLDLEESIGAEKRQRLTPNNSEMDSSHISETVLRGSSTPIATKPFVSSTEDESGQISSLLEKVRNLESQLRVKCAKELELREINQDLESRCRSYEDSMASIQPKYQEALNDRGDFEHQNNLSMAREMKMKKERDNKDAEVIKLREKNLELEDKLSAAETALRTSAVPEAAELATLRDELAKSKLENEREHKRYVNATNDLDYIRSTFQTSSSSAAEQQAELSRLQTEVDAFREKAAFDKVRIQEIQSMNENAELRQENAELRARLKDLERDYDKKQQELMAVTNGRRGTRGTSVPQSPRMGNQNQNSPGPRPISRVLQGGSRGNSPAPGDVRITGGPGPIAGGNFGDALFPNSLPPPPPRERWGQHLQ